MAEARRSITGRCASIPRARRTFCRFFYDSGPGACQFQVLPNNPIGSAACSELRQFMALEEGTHLGPYEIVAPLGAGGMGEVYRARDTRLDREVAIKVLPDAMTRDPERVARFGRQQSGTKRSSPRPNRATNRQNANP